MERTHLTAKTIAGRFLKEQIGIMKRHGHAPVLSAEAYSKLLEETSRSFEALRPGKAKRTGRHVVADGRE